jgi:hypothetical protein
MDSLSSVEMPKSIAVQLPDAPVGLPREMFGKMKTQLTPRQEEVLQTTTQLLNTLFQHDKALVLQQAGGQNLEEKPYLEKQFEEAPTLKEQFYKSEHIGSGPQDLDEPDADHSYSWTVFYEKGWKAVDRPRLKIVYRFKNPRQLENGGQYELQFEGRFNAASDFNNVPVPGTRLSNVQICDDGSIVTGKGYNSEGRALTDREMHNLNKTLEFLRDNLDDPYASIPRHSEDQFDHTADPFRHSYKPQ